MAEVSLVGVMCVGLVIVVAIVATITFMNNNTGSNSGLNNSTQYYAAQQNTATTFNYSQPMIWVALIIAAAMAIVTILLKMTGGLGL
jgi:hypothetical protein